MTNYTENRICESLEDIKRAMKMNNTLCILNELKLEGEIDKDEYIIRLKELLKLL